MAIFAFSTVIGPVPIEVVVTEKHNSTIAITELPVENGARITDHAFLVPKKLTLDCATSNAAASYNALVLFQESRVPFTIVTGLFIYENMLVKSIDAERDREFSQVLRFTAELQEIIIVSTAYTADPNGTAPDSGADAAANRKNTGDPVNANSATDSATADRAAGTVTRGDTAGQTTDSSPLQQYLGTGG